MIRNWIRAHEPDADDEKARKRHDGRQLGSASTFDGMVHLQGLLPAVGGQEFLAELHRLERDLYRQDQASGSQRTAAQRWADQCRQQRDQVPTPQPRRTTPQPGTHRLAHLATPTRLGPPQRRIAPSRHRRRRRRRRRRR